MKTYVIILSRHFPATHPKAGQPTGFRDNFRENKLHTIRANYELWAKRFEKIDRGEACLSIREWSGKPYRSKQVEIARLTREDGIGIQRIELARDLSGAYLDKQHRHPVGPVKYLAHKDGLSLADWRDWFKGHNFSKPLAIIHFTEFRY